MILSFTELQKKRHRFQNEPRVVQQLLSIWRSLLVSLAVRLELPLTGKHLVDLLLNDFYQSWKRIKIEICISIGAKIPHNQRNGMKFHQCWKIKLKWNEKKKTGTRDRENAKKSQCLPAWHTITSDTTAFAVVFIAEFSTAGPRCSDCRCRRRIWRPGCIWCGMIVA